MSERKNGMLAITGGRVIDPSQGIDRVADVLIRDGKIESIARAGSAPEGYQKIDAGGRVVAPGFVDLHTHLREPGLEYKETLATGTAAAARGGFTTVCAMPNTEPAQDTASIIEYVARRARESGVVRVLPIGAVTMGRHGKQLTEMAEMAAAGAIGFSDDGDPVADPNMMRQALSYSSSLGLPIINHCQEPGLTRGAQMHEGVVSSNLGLAGWPAEAEASMVARDIALAELTGGRLHIAHLSTAAAVDLVRAAKARGARVTAEVTPHHLTLTDTWVYGLKGAERRSAVGLASYDTNTKVNPPLRAASDVDALVAALGEGVIDFVATDHAPHSESEKACTYVEAANGISNLETAFASVVSLFHAGRLSMPQVIERMSTAPGKFLALGKRHGEEARFGLFGTLKPGHPADVVVLDLNAEWVVDPARFVSKGKNTPLAGVTLKGRVVTTVFGGSVVWQGGASA